MVVLIVCMSECEYVHIECNSSGCQKRVLHALDLELESVVSCSIWVLGTGLESSAKAANEPHLQSLSPPFF